MKPKLDISMLIATLIGGAAIAGLVFNASYSLDYSELPKFLQPTLQTAIFLAFAALVLSCAVCVALFFFNGKRIGSSNSGLSERGHLLRYKERAVKYAVAVSSVFVLVSGVLGGATEAIYYSASGSPIMSRERAGSFIVADFSESMQGHDSMKTALEDYIRDIDRMELFGIILYSDEIIKPAKPDDMSEEDYIQAIKPFYDYVYIEDNTQKENIISIINNTDFDGNTNTNEAVTSALKRIRNAQNRPEYERLKDKRYYPCEIILFSDGEATTPIDYTDIKYLSIEVGKIIPVSTVFYGSENAKGASEMRKIASETGGKFNYITTSAQLKTVFTDVSDSFEFSKPMLLYPVVGPLKWDGIRIFLQWILICSWIATSSFAVYILVGSQSHKKDFKIKFLWGAALTLLAVFAISNGHPVLTVIGRIFIAISFAFVFPLYNRELRKKEG